MLERHCSDARFVWNLALEQANLYRSQRGPTPTHAERNHQLAEARRDSWLGDGSSSVQKAAPCDVDQALRNWWGGSHRRPTWRVKGINESFCVRDVVVKKLNRRWASVNVPTLGAVKFRRSRPLPDKYGMARVTLDKAGRWHVSFTAAPLAKERVTTGAEVDIDRGVTTTLVTSDGQMFRIPTSPKVVVKNKRRQQRLARQRKDSHRRAKTTLQLATTHARIADRRKDWVEKVTTRPVDEYDVIVLEDLKVKNMVKSPKAQQSGVGVLRVNPAFTSQQCHECGHIAKENRESQAIYRCVWCGHQTHADINAARNILARGTSSRHPQDVGTCASSNAGVGARTSPPAIRRRTTARTLETKVAWWRPTQESPSARAGRMSTL